MGNRIAQPPLSDLATCVAQIPLDTGFVIQGITVTFNGGFGGGYTLAQATLDGLLPVVMNDPEAPSEQERDGDQ